MTRIVPGLVFAVFFLVLALMPHPTGSQPGLTVKRYGGVIGLRPEKVMEYRRLHAAVWPGVLSRLRACNIRNYSIFLKEIRPGEFCLFSYYEYTGSDYAGDMARLSADPDIRAWWKLTDPCQSPLPSRRPGEFWAGMEEVFHLE